MPLAQVNDGPCTTYLGSIGSGNYVKMVHNGIEYGDMQLIAEVRRGGISLYMIGKLSITFRGNSATPPVASACSPQV